MFGLELGALLYAGERNPRNRLMDMMHSGTPSSVKGNVLHHSADQTKCLRVLIATTADGMEANCKGVIQRQTTYKRVVTVDTMGSKVMHSCCTMV